MVCAVNPMPRPKSLTQTQIARAAMRVIEREGLAALSMRTVASELGVGTMSLYRYVDSREQLERWVVAALYDTLDPETPSDAAWTVRLATLLERMRKAAAEHPALVPLLVTRGHTAQGLLRWLEAILALLAGAGFSAEERMYATRALGGFVIGAVQLEHLAPVSGRAAQLPAHEHTAYPLLLEAAKTGRHVAPQQEFERGLSLMLDGLHRTRAGRREPRPARTRSGAARKRPRSR